LKLIDALHQGLADPSHPPTAVIEKYSQGPGRGVMLGAIADEKAHGRAWRGTPDQSRVLVVTTKPKVNEVILSDCALPSPAWQEYDLKTGKVVPQPKQMPPPPYLTTASMFKIQGTWVMVAFTLDGSRTCTR
jgi:hypothetical protein